MKELLTRSIWGFVFAVSLTGAILIGSFTFAALFLTLSVFVLREFYSLCSKAGFSPQVYPGLGVGGLIYLFSFLVAEDYFPAKVFLYLLPLVYASFVYELYRNKKNPLVNISLTLLGIIYVTIPFSILNFLAFPASHDGPMYSNVVIISLFLFVWASDSGAYLFGVRFGKHRLFERISPKKSWEGLLGGVVTALLVAWLLTFVYHQYSLFLLGGMAIVIVISGTLGDLIESMIKRSLGIKDSGKFMPGHGGLLDRFDSILLASPAIYFMLQFFN